MFQTILIVLCPLIALIALGYGLKRSKWLSLEFWQGAEKLNYYVMFPIMLFMSLASAQLQLNVIQDVLQTLSIITVITCIVLYICKSLFHIPISRFGVYVQSTLRFNSYIGIALISGLFQQAGMAIFAIIMVFFIPLVNVISVVSLTDIQRLSLKNILINVFKNPLILGCLAGGAFNWSGLNLWAGFDQLFKLLAACSLPLGLMCVGAALRFKGIRSHIMRLSTTTAVRMLLMPIFGYVMCRWMGLDTLSTQVITVFFALPTASASYILTKVYGGDSDLMASIITIQTVVSAISLMLILSLMH
jgi:malonate transporter and related proteins